MNERQRETHAVDVPLTLPKLVKRLDTFDRLVEGVGTIDPAVLFKRRVVKVARFLQQFGKDSVKSFALCSLENKTTDLVTAE